MSRTARFLFAPVEESQSSRDFLPFLPIGLISRNQQAVVVAAKIEGFEPVNLTFAWTRSPNAPLILGQMNFFLEFNVCFFRTESAFELSKP
jgi:hypothetical protein